MFVVITAANNNLLVMLPLISYRLSCLLLSQLLIIMIFWRTVLASALTSAPAWDWTGAPLARSKALSHYPVVAAYFCGVQAPPQGSPPAWRLLSVVLWAGCSRVRCWRGVWRRRIVHSGGAAARTRTLLVICEYHIKVTTLEYCRRRL